jgi:hypothetical protein
LIKVCLIPPGSLAQQFCGARPYQMMLAGSLLDASQHDYGDFYAGLTDRPVVDELRLLDNGAWEAQSVDPGTLLKLAAEYGATEVIAPDTLSDHTRTLRQLKEFTGLYHQFMDRNALGEQLRLAAVVHGSTMDSAKWFVHSVANLNMRCLTCQVKTIAIGRAFSRKVGVARARWELAVWIRDEFPEFQIHLLGYNDDWPEELMACRDIVYSIDTTLPFTASLKNRDRTQVSTRPSNYFSTTPEDYDLGYLQFTIEYLDEMAGESWKTNQ